MKSAISTLYLIKPVSAVLFILNWCFNWQHHFSGKISKPIIKL